MDLELVEMALRARTRDDVDSLEERLQQEGVFRERYLGDNEANFSSLSTAADPRVLIFERVTNAFDAMVELAIHTSATDPDSLTSPLIASQRLLNMPVTGNMLDLSKEVRETRGGQIVLTVNDSDDSRRRPTISVRDYGIGISRTEAPKTILSLEATNKLHKFYAHGVFGKGGSLASEYSEATVFVMRKDPRFLHREADLVTVAVVRRQDRPDVRLPYHRYLVIESDVDPRGLPYSIAAGDTDFPPGVYVAHINYEAKRMGESGWRQETSIATFADTLLFRPTLPYTIRDSRTGKANMRPPGREAGIFTGLGARLDRPTLEVSGDDTDKSPAIIARGGAPSHAIASVGAVKIRWQVFSSRDRRRSYAAPGYVVIFTHGGQVHHAWNQQRFVEKVGLRRVAERVFVEVDTSAIPAKLTHQIFSSFRNEVRDVAAAEALEVAVASWLRNDGDLADAEAKLQREALQHTTQRLSAELIDRLNKAISAKLPMVGFSPNGSGRPKTPRPKKRAPEELGDEPTYLQGPDTVTILPGETIHFYLLSNGRDGFVPESAEPELDGGPKGLLLSYGYLSGGRLLVALEANHAATLGEHLVAIRLDFLARAGGLKSVSHHVRVKVVAERPAAPVPPPIPPAGGKSQKDEASPRSFFAFRWVSEPEKEPGWVPQTAGDLQMVAASELAAVNDAYAHLKDYPGDVPTIALNEKFPLWDGYRRSISSSDATLAAREEEYVVGMSVVIADLWVGEENRSKSQSAQDGEETEKAMTESQRRRAISVAARGIIAMLPQFDKLMAAALVSS
jgi:hypothetical protein